MHCRILEKNITFITLIFFKTRCEFDLNIIL